MKRIIIIFFALIMSSLLHSEQTIGLFYNTPQSYDGYTLFAPSLSNVTYLIDNCGEKVHSWVTNTTPGNTVYLLENSVLLRTGKTENDIFNSGGYGGLIQMLDWNSNLIWEYTISDSMQCQHHDIEPLPNGNILILVWVYHTMEEAEQAGRIIPPNELWSERVIEIKPDLVSGGSEIVWEWDTWDHLVQDNSEDFGNYGDVTNPRKINLNYSTKGFNNKDWLHINSIDYNPRLDQILLSNHNFGEVFIIDHSTTTAEAMTDKGGKYGHGGDLLYRWGNPMSYGKGTEDDIKLITQHDPHWIPDSLTDGGKIMIFNNNVGNLEGLEYSAIYIIDPEKDDNEDYTLFEGKFGPSDPYWTYMGDPKTGFFSRNLSGSQRLPNGNTLICSGFNGTFFEITPNNEKVWKYVNPSGGNSVIRIQNQIIEGNQAFRAERLSKNHPALLGKELDPMGYIEIGSDFTCELYDNQTSVSTEDNTDIVLNQFTDRIEFDSKEIITQIEIFNSIGVKIYETSSLIQKNSISTVNFGTGVYFLKIHLNNKNAYKKIMIN
ncbi:MAG: aryl-sulfate sulfotransferase [Candidatus Kapaibacterium sp.]